MKSGNPHPDIERFTDMRVILAIAIVNVFAPAIASAADAWPTKPIRLIVPQAPGSNSDIVSRIIAGKLSDLLGQQMVIDNRTGATGMIGVEMAAHAAANGYTLLAGSVVTHAQLPITYKKLPYDPVKDFAPISILYLTDVLLGVHPSLPVKTVKEFIAYAKSKPNELNYASAGTGSVAHLAGVMLISMTGITSTHVPYKGGAANILAVAAGESQWLAAPLGSTIGQVRAGRIRALAVGGSERSSFMPELPTLSEAGVPGYQFYTWNGLMAPAGTPRAVIDTLHAAVLKAVKLPEVREQYAAAGMEVRSSATPEEFGTFIAQEQAKMRRLAASGGLKPE
jgi:tripartite-type tricarboxylate transporter receptor subunit TctC